MCVYVTVERAQPGMVLIRPHTSHCLIWCVCGDHFSGTGVKPDTHIHVPSSLSLPPTHKLLGSEEAAKTSRSRQERETEGLTVPLSGPDQHSIRGFR